MAASWHVDRRSFLRGVGAGIALPMLDAMLPSAAIAAADKAKNPRRLAVFFVPNGVHMPDWTPKQEGADFDLPATLQPLEPFKKQLSVLSGLTHDKGRANGDGPGDHARSAASFLTGCQARKTAGADIKLGVSIDQLAAQKTGSATRFPSLELGCEQGATSGNCDSGYSCAYSNTISWRSETTPVPHETNPRQVFERLFAGAKRNETADSRGKRERERKSILDLVQEDARDLRSKLGVRDQQKLDEYLYAIREVESRIQQSELVDRDGAVNIAQPKGTPREYGDHLRLMFDLLALALQTDQTRITTFMLANEGSNRGYSHIGVREGHHDLSHHGGNKEKQEKISKINRFHMDQFAHFVRRVASVREGNGTLLDNCMVLYGAGIGDGNAHNHDNLPMLTLGSGGGVLETGKHVRYRRNTPMNNLYLSLLERLDIKLDRFGDSTGKLLPTIG